MTKILTLLLSIFLFNFQSMADLDYSPYASEYNDGVFEKVFFESEEEMNEAIGSLRTHYLENMNATSHTAATLELNDMNLNEALNELLEQFEVGQILFLTTIKDADSAIEQRIEDKEHVALTGKPFRRFLQSSYCLLVSPLAYFTDPLCFNAREDASVVINELQNREIWFRYIVNTEAVKIVLDSNGQKGFSLYESNFTLNPFASSDRPFYVFSDALTTSETVEALSKVYFYHSLTDDLFRNTYISTKIFKVYEVQ